LLPDFPDIKGDVTARLVEFLEARREYHLGPLSEVVHVRFFEGDGFGITRPSGEREPGEYKQVESTIEIKHEEIPTMTLDTLLAKLDEAAQGLARQIAEDMYRTISDAIQSAGNVIDAKGERLTAQTILDALSMLQIDFEADGTPRMPQMHVHPSLAEAVQRAGEELDRNPELKKQLGELWIIKREEWRAREASRKLVG